MEYKFTDIVADSSFNPKESDKINRCLIKNTNNDIIKAIEFLNSDEKLLYIHGFIGSGKRQFVSYICEYILNDVKILQYFCKEATVCDDILLSFTDILQESSSTKTVSFNAKITTMSERFMQLISAVKKPVLIILHSIDNINDNNLKILNDTLTKVLKEPNIKIIMTTCALKTNIIGEFDEDRRIFLKAFTKEIFNEYLQENNITASGRQTDDLYAVTRGYYFYTTLSIKIMQSLNISVAEFLQKIKNTDLSFDKYLGELYISLLPSAIRNFFWFLRAVRHGLSLNALAILEIYDEFSIQYLTSNLIAFVVDDYIYLHDYFAQRVDIILPVNTEVKLHKYIIGIYEQQLKESLANRAIFISRQALREEINYHTQRINDITNESTERDSTPEIENNLSQQLQVTNNTAPTGQEKISINKQIDEAKKLISADKITEGIEKYQAIADSGEIDSSTLIDIRLTLAKLYAQIGDYTASMHYYELVESYYIHNNESINLNYLYYDMTDLYYKMYKHKRAIETIKKVIYSVDTPQSLMVSACTLLGNIYSDMNNSNEAFTYYKKALESLDENVDPNTLSELYFKFALANDDRNDTKQAFEYYSKCISIVNQNKYLALAYSNLASCYYENGNFDDALNCFMKAYTIEKEQNNYDGIYYTASHIAKILNENNDENAINYYKEALQSAEFIDEAFYITEAHVALGDYYYNLPEMTTKALEEYIKAKRTAINSTENIDISNITKRIQDMKLRMKTSDFEEIIKKYDR